MEKVKKIFTSIALLLHSIMLREEIGLSCHFRTISFDMTNYSTKTILGQWTANMSKGGRKCEGNEMAAGSS